MGALVDAVPSALVLAVAVFAAAAFVVKTHGALFDGPSFGKDFQWQASTGGATGRRCGPARDLVSRSIVRRAA